jgi:hypothetical protein
MNLTEIDGTLSRLRGASDAISANLMELDADPNRMLLESAALRGETAKRWDEANRTLVDMWKLLTRFTDVLDRAGELRGSRSRLSPDAEIQIDELLTGPSIELEREEIPLHERALTSGREATTHCTPDDLLDVMSKSFERAKELIFGVSDVWERLVPRLRSTQVALDAATANAVGLGEEPDRQMQDLQRRLDEIGDLLVIDPLAADPAAIDALERDVNDLEGSFGDAMQLRADLQPRIDAAHELLRKLHDTASEAEAAHENTIVKIASPQVPAPVVIDADVSDELDRVVALAQQGKWREANAALAAWTDRAEGLQRDGDACLRANLAPIEARDELRGRLDAYRAMAHDRGLIEDPEVSRRYDEAHDALFTAPTDLAEAAALVRNYREVLPGDSAERKVPM